MKSILSLSMAVLAISGFAQKQAQKPNVLFIAVDDLKPLIGAYGDKHAKTPGMDRLAREGVVFQNSYCQQAVCGPTRASLLTGMRPDRTKVWDLVTDFRQVNPNVVTIPQHFKSMGYETSGMGKIYHTTGPGNDAPSWSVPYRKPESTHAKYVLPYTPNAIGRGPAYECADVSDETYRDGQLAIMATAMLDSLSQNKKPFFLAVGFIRPHLPFNAPKKYWDLYDRDEFEVANFQKKALNSPNIAYHGSGELKFYSDIPEFDSFSENEMDRLPIEKQKALIHGYYAAMSYVDAQIVKLLDELDRLKIRDNTIIVLWGDHGWHLGDHGLWNKHSNFEQAAHAPLIMSVPGMKKDIKPTTLCEFVDIFPTLCELANLPIPNFLDGKSLVSAIKNPNVVIHQFALSQYPRGNNTMGYSMRTSRFRYTEWMGDNYTTEKPYDKKYMIAREMYDYEKDPLETENVLDKPEYAKEQMKLEKLFGESMQREHIKYMNYAKIADFHKPISTKGESQ